MSLSTLFLAVGAKIIKGAFIAVKGVLAATSKSLFSKFIYGGIMIAASALTSRSLFASSQKGTSASPTYQNFKYTQTNPDLPLPIIYGTVQTAGNLIWQNSQDAFSQKIIAFAEGEITDFTDIRINDIPISQIKDAQVEKFFGTENQLIAAIAPGASQLEKSSNVGSLKNVAYLALTVFNDEKINSNYNLTTVIKGKKVRVYSSETEYIIKYSENPAWILLDFLTAYNGLGLALDDSSKIDDSLISSVFDMQSFLESAAYCDAIVNDAKRFTFNMIFDSQTSVRSLLDEIYRCCRGGLFLKNGQLQFKIDKAEHISKVFTSDDISNEVFKAVPSEEHYDILKVVYISPEHEWQKVEAFAEIPEYRSGAPVENSVAIYSCTNFEQASRLAWYYSNSKVLQPYYGSFDTDYRAYDLEVGDVIKFDSLLMGLSGYKAKVTQVTDDGAGTYTVNWQTYDERLYADNKGSLAPRLLVTKLNDLYKYPDDVRNFNVVQNQDNFVFVWQFNDNTSDTYEIRVGNSWENGNVIASGIKTNSFISQIANKGMFSFWIKAFNNYNYSENATSDVLLVQDIPQLNVIVNWDLIGEDNLFVPGSSSDTRSFQNCYIYRNVLKPMPQAQWINPLEKAIENGCEKSIEIIQADDASEEYLELEEDFSSCQTTEIVVFKPDNYSIVGSPNISEDGTASDFSANNYIVFQNSIGTDYSTFDIKFKFNTKTRTSPYILGAKSMYGGFLFGWGSNGKFAIWGSTSPDVSCWDVFVSYGQHKVLENTDYWIDFLFNGTQYILSYSLDGINYIEDMVINSATKLYIQSSLNIGYLLGGKSDYIHYLNNFKIFIDDNLVYQPCLKLPCKVSADKKYIADAKYRDRVYDIFSQAGATTIYTIDTDNKNFTRACSKYDDYLWDGWERFYDPSYETKDGRWGTETAKENIFISQIFDVGKELESSVSLELQTDNSDVLSNDILVLWRYSSDAVNWTDYMILNRGMYIFRYAQFKLILNCLNNQYLSVKTAKISVDVPDKDASYQIYVSDAEQGFYLNYSDKRFVTPPSIVATVTDNISAYAVTTEKTSNGARIYAVTNEGIKTNGTIDLQIKGY